MFDSRLLFTVGNLHGGYVYGVEAVRQFGTTEVHGPFNTENNANNYAHRLIELGETPSDGPYFSVKVVRLETPQVGVPIFWTGSRYSYGKEDHA